MAGAALDHPGGPDLFRSPPRPIHSPSRATTSSLMRLDGRLNLRGPDSRTMPYLLVGLMAGHSTTTGTPPDQLVRGAPSLGLGALINLRNQRAYLRLQIRDTFFRQRDAKEFDNDFTPDGRAALGVRRQASATPTWTGARVARPVPGHGDRRQGQRRGMSLDGDGDGVYDGLTSVPTRRRAARWTRTDARSTATATGLRRRGSVPRHTEGRVGGREGLSQRHRSRRCFHTHRSVSRHAGRAARWTPRVARSTATATGSATASTSVRTRRRGSR